MNLITLSLYQLLLVLLSPLVFLFTLRDARRRQGGQRFCRQRMGLHYAADFSGALWIHAASMGEVNAVKPLIQLIQQRDPAQRILLTTATPAGYQAIKSHLGTTLQHAYLPFDLPWAVNHFLRRYQPGQLVIVETELWPNLLRAARKAGARPIIINGRLSPRTLQQRWLFPLFRYCLQQCSAIYTRSQDDNRSFLRLGAQRQQLLTVGNIKFAGELLEPTHFERLVERPYLLAASTHHDEEWQFVHSLVGTSKLLVIIPRHPERRDEILQELARLPLSVAVRSRGDDVDDNTQVYLADTMGEMQAFMAHAELVFVGGSLVAHGGQNLLEAARLGKAILCGPHTWNFADEVAALKGADGMQEVNNADELRTTVNALLNNSDEVARLGAAARELMENNGGIARHYDKLLRKNLKS